MTLKGHQAVKMEKRLMQSLDHPNIMKLLDYFEDDRHIYMVMDLMIDDVRNVMLSKPGRFDEVIARSIFTMML